MSISAYDLIEIIVGPHESTARPIEWDGKDYDGQGNDEHGKPIGAIIYMTTCPGCAQLLQFKKEDLYIAADKTVNNVKCGICKLGRPSVPTPDEVHDLIVVLDEPSDLPEEDESESLPSNIFVDPVLNGDFTIPVDADRL
jgi:hypothetical protein